MDQAVSRRPLTAGAGVGALVGPSGTCGGPSGTVTEFSQRSSVFFCQYNSTGAPYSYIIWGMNSRFVDGRSSETSSHLIDLNNIKHLVRNGPWRL
jgi:hypothetical protein